MDTKRGKIKKSKVISLGILFVCTILIVISFTSANVFSDLWGQITGQASFGTTALNITIGNAAPTIPSVYINTTYDPVIGSTKSITFNFTATDTDGATNINISSSAAYFQKAGETTRSNTTGCQNYTAVGNSINFSCTVNMYYYDQNGAWTINATIKDNNNAYVENSTYPFTYNLLTAMVMSPTSLNWGAVGVSTTNAGSNNDPIAINNSGNDEPLNINVTALNLQGETTATQFIYANNFTIENATEGCTAGTAMVNASSINVTSSILQRGNNSLNYNNATSGQEQVYFCLKGVNSDLSAQSYSSAAYGAWTVAIIT